MKKNPKFARQLRWPTSVAGGGQLVALNSRLPFLAPLLTLALLALAAAGVTAQTYTILHNFGGLTDPTGCQSKAPLVQGPDGTLYGTGTASGFYGGNGTVFKIQPDGTGFTLLKDFTNSVDGANPWGGLVLSGTTLYGTTYQGGSSNYGTVFKINTDGSDFAVLKNFGYSDGYRPAAGLVLSGATLYGTTEGGGTGGWGTVFRVNTEGTDFTVLHNFANLNTAGGKPRGGLVLAGDTLYGTTMQGGFSGPTVFQINTDGSGFAVVGFFGANVQPAAGLVLSGSSLFGTTQSGGNSGCGTVFMVSTGGSANWTTLKYFQGTDGASPAAPLVLSGSTLFGTTTSGGTSNLGTVFSLETDGSNFMVLKNFSGTDGSQPYAGLWLSGPTLYGTTYSGGTSSGGTVFKVNTNGQAFATLKQLQYNCTDGYLPVGDLALSGTTLYGVAMGGGSSDNGILFKINTDGSGYSVLKNFSTYEGYPYGGLVLSSNTLLGATEGAYIGGGDILFKVGTDGGGYSVVLATNVTVTAPYTRFVLSGSTLYEATDDTIFSINTDGTGITVITNWGFRAGFTMSGTTLYGVYPDRSMLLKLNTDGTGFTVIKAYDWSDDLPSGYLTLSGTTLYGTTVYDTVFSVNTDGSNYQVLAQLTANEGTEPQGLALSGMTLYGTAYEGGDYNAGTVFQANTDGSGFKVLKQFTGYSPGDGLCPCPNLVVSGTTLFGTAESGGLFDPGGVLFSLSVAPVLQMVNPVCVGTDFTFAFQSQSNQSYTLESNDDLSTTNWQCCGTMTGDGALMPCCITMTNGAQRFFRVRQP